MIDFFGRKVGEIISPSGLETNTFNAKLCMFEVIRPTAYYEKKLVVLTAVVSQKGGMTDRAEDNAHVKIYHEFLYLS